MQPHGRHTFAPMRDDCLDDAELVAFADGAPVDAARVNAHVASCSECRAVLAELGRGAGERVAEDAPLKRGATVGRYVLEDCIGAGGMGVVYAAVDPELKRRVAVKLLPERRDPEARARFDAERRILASLDHPNICRLLDGGQTPSGRPYLAMELVEGLPIDRACDERRLSTSQRLALFRQVCAAVHYAHQHLVVHRDLKATNILVTAQGVPKLLDFGIARLLDLEGEAARLTATGTQPMTPSTASPEQVRGEPVTTASDVYSLGAVLYELVSGAGPYAVSERSVVQLLEAVLHQELQRPSEAVARATDAAVQAREGSRERLARRLAGDVDAMVLMALRKEPDSRYASAERLSEDLRCHLEGLPTAARRGSWAYRASRFVRRHALGAAALAGVFLALSGGAAATWWQAHQARLERDRAARRFEQLRALAHSVLFDYHDGIAALPGSTALRERLVKDALFYLDALAPDAAGDPSLQRELATAYLKIGDVQGNPFSPSLGQPAAALVSYGRAQALCEALLRADPKNRPTRLLFASSERKFGDVLQGRDDNAGAQAKYEAALAADEALVAEDPADREARFALTEDLENVAQLLNLAEQPERALALLERARALSEALVAQQPDERSRRGLAGALVAIADVAAYSGDLETGLAGYEKAIAADRESLAASPADAKLRDHLAAVLYRYANVLVLVDRRAEALPVLREVEALDLAAVTADPKDAAARRVLGVTDEFLAKQLRATGAVKEALAYRHRAVEQYRLRVAADPGGAEARADLLEALWPLAEAASEVGEPALAEQSLREALDLAEALLAEAPASVKARADLADVHLSLGRLALTRQRVEEALTHQARAVELYAGVVKDAPGNRHLARIQAVALSAAGMAHLRLAGDVRQPAAARAAHRAAARAALEQARAAWLALREVQILSPESEQTLDEVEAALRQVAK